MRREDRCHRALGDYGVMAIIPPRNHRVIILDRNDELNLRGWILGLRHIYFGVQNYTGKSICRWLPHLFWTFSMDHVLALKFAHHVRWFVVAPKLT